MSLDDTLKQIIIDEGGDGSDYAVIDIRTAFEESGYIPTLTINGRTIVVNGNTPLGYVVYYPDQVMTCQEWYDRYEAELRDKIFPTGNDSQYVVDAVNRCAEAAKKASGIL